MPALPLLDPPLSDGQIALRHWHERDASALAMLCQDEAIVRWTDVPSGYTEQMARARIAEVDAERNSGRALVLAVVDADTDELLGTCDLRVAPDDRERAEVPYMLGAHARGRGAMTRAVRLISQWARTQLGIKRLEIMAHPENRASIAVAERAGFEREGVLRGYREKRGRREDRLVLSHEQRGARPTR